MALGVAKVYRDCTPEYLQFTIDASKRIFSYSRLEQFWKQNTIDFY